MTWKFWQRTRSERLEKSFEDELLYRLALIDRRLGRMESDVAKMAQDLEQLKNDSSVTRAAVVEIDKTINGHLNSHEKDAAKPRTEGELRLLRNSKTLSEAE